MLFTNTLNTGVLQSCAHLFGTYSPYGFILFNKGDKVNTMKGGKPVSSMTQACDPGAREPGHPSAGSEASGSKLFCSA